MDWSEITTLLGYYNYRNILKDDIVSSMETVYFTNICGEYFYETRTWLSNKKSVAPTYELYGDADGTGTSKIKLISQLKSISESLERLAFYENYNSDMYGFKYEKTTTGMAALPRIFAEKTSSLSKNEAIERWAIIEWWNGNLKANEIEQDRGVHFFEIQLPSQGINVVIAFAKNKEQYAYGFAASQTKKRALHKAIIELDRNSFILNRSKNRLPNHIDEKRLLYFANEMGHEHFKHVHAQSLSLNKNQITPRCLYSGEIIGEWSKYSCVWRTLYEYSDNSFLNPQNDFFLF